MERVPSTEVLESVRQRLRALGIVSAGDLDAFCNLVKVGTRIGRGASIIDASRSVKHFTLLLDGLACMSSRYEDSGRQIYAFHYPGDFLALNGFLFPRSKELIEVQALTECSIGTIDHDLLERIIRHYPALGQALWRAAMIEASIFRQRLVMMRWPALRRVAHLLCEQLQRLGTIDVVPLSQVDIADAVGLSIVHTNRIFHELRTLGVLSERRRRIEVVNKKRLQELAVFGGRYQNAKGGLSQWELRIEE